ncbi:MAG: regulatory protein RecX [Pseudomonadota bacterium]
MTTRAEGVLVDEVLDRLAASGTQSDERFRAAYVRVRVARGYGPLKIAAGLAERGVDTAGEWLVDDEPPDWPSLCTQLWERRFGAPPDSRRAWERQARFLAGRGFPESVVRRTVPRWR